MQNRKTQRERQWGFTVMVLVVFAVVAAMLGHGEKAEPVLLFDWAEEFEKGALHGVTLTAPSESALVEVVPEDQGVHEAATPPIPVEGGSPFLQRPAPEPPAFLPLPKLEPVPSSSLLPAPSLSAEAEPSPGVEGEVERPGEGNEWGVAFSVYRLSYPDLGIADAPVARPSMKFWAKQEWDKLEEQLQFALRTGLTVYPHSPSFGRPGNTVVAGHSSPPPAAEEGSASRLFASLPSAEKGDRIELKRGNRTLEFEVTETRVVPPGDVSVLLQRDDRTELTLITCYPVGTIQSRFIVRAKLVEAAEKVALR